MMDHHLDESTVARFERDGIVFPIRVLSAEEAEEHRATLAAIESTRAGRLPPLTNVKAHLVIPAVSDIVHDPRVLDPVEALIGPDLVCWGASFFAKPPASSDVVPWHQDTTYWGLTEPRAVTAWLAITDSTPENGGMRVVCGSHRTPLAHRDAGIEHSMLPVGEEVAVTVDEADATDVVLSPGEMSIHHGLLIHGSEANRSDRPRIGLAIRYVAADVAQKDGARISATLVRGRDHGHYALEERPEGLFHPAAVGRLHPIMRAFADTVRLEKERADAAA